MSVIYVRQLKSTSTKQLANQVPNYKKAFPLSLLTSPSDTLSAQTYTYTYTQRDSLIDRSTNDDHRVAAEPACRGAISSDRPRAHNSLLAAQDSRTLLRRRHCRDQFMRLGALGATSYVYVVFKRYDIYDVL